MVDRKGLKRQYKESRQPIGVFRIRNTRNGRSLVAASVNLPAIFNRMRMQLNSGSALTYPELQRDWKQFGADAFEFEVLEELEPPDSPTWDPAPDLAALEALWLEELAPYEERGYNRRPKGNSVG